VGPRDQVKYQQWQAYQAEIKMRMASSRPVSAQVILESLSTSAQLKTWLQTKAPQEIVGDAQTPDKRIVPNFCWEIVGVYVMFFGKELVDLNDNWIEVPAWCQEFSRVDWEHQIAHHIGEYTAAEALAMLEEAEDRLHSGGFK
jgi:hypothetical protein